MEESIYNAREELKRVDHLIYVSLKYTRTGDVLKSVVTRLMNTYDCIIQGLLKQLKEKKKIADISDLPGIRAETVKKYYSSNEQIIKAIAFYQFLRRVHNAEFTAIQEFRRGVTMTANLADKPVDIDIDTVMQYYKDTLDFMEYFEEIYFSTDEQSD